MLINTIILKLFFTITTNLLFSLLFSFYLVDLYSSTISKLSCFSAQSRPKPFQSCLPLIIFCSAHICFSTYLYSVFIFLCYLSWRFPLTSAAPLLLLLPHLLTASESGVPFLTHGPLLVRPHPCTLSLRINFLSLNQHALHCFARLIPTLKLCDLIQFYTE